MLIYLGVGLVCLAVAVLSANYLGHDNAIEQVAEEVAETIIETELNLPHNSIDIDVSKEK